MCFSAIMDSTLTFAVHPTYQTFEAFPRVAVSLTASQERLGECNLICALNMTSLCVTRPRFVTVPWMLYRFRMGAYPNYVKQIVWFETGKSNSNWMRKRRPKR